MVAVVGSAGAVLSDDVGFAMKQRWCGWWTPEGVQYRRIWARSVYPLFGYVVASGKVTSYTVDVVVGSRRRCFWAGSRDRVRSVGLSPLRIPDVGPRLGG